MLFHVRPQGILVIGGEQVWTGDLAHSLPGLQGSLGLSDKRLSASSPREITGPHNAESCGGDIGQIALGGSV
jgi:hypothetical protein